MTRAIFREDLTISQMRALAVQRLLTMCPSGYRLIMRPLVEEVIGRATNHEIAALLIDIEQVRELAKSGNSAGIGAIARRYGATQAQVDAFLPKNANL